MGLGYLRRLPSRRYTLGPSLVRLGDSAARLLGRWAAPVLAELVDATGETANLAVLDGDQAAYVAQVPSPHSVRMFTEIGRRVPLHCTGRASLPWWWPPPTGSGPSWRGGSAQPVLSTPVMASAIASAAAMTSTSCSVRRGPTPTSTPMIVRW